MAGAAALMLPPETLAAATALVAKLTAAGLTVTAAESCTGGLIAAAITSVPGSSSVLGTGFVTYSNAAKTALLGVPQATLAAVGAVSAEVAAAMATGALERSGADLAVSCTGIAGPGGATPGKPVGLVFLGVARRGGEPRTVREQFAGDRDAVRAASVARALALLSGATAQ